MQLLISSRNLSNCKQYLVDVTAKKHTMPENILPRHFLQAAAERFPDSYFTAALISISEVAAWPQNRIKLWLGQPELQRLASYKLAKRRSEWLAGRICAKLAIASMNDAIHPDAFDKLHIDNDQEGRPYVLYTGGEKPEKEKQISISHSNDLAAAIASDHHCGIDVQQYNDTLLKVKERFCSSTEQEILQQNLGIQLQSMDLCLLWSAKEAIRKACSHCFIPSFLRLRLSDFHGLDNGCCSLVFRLKDSIFTTVCCRYGHSALAVCLIRE